MADDKARVLFICVHNSGRSQMAEAFLNDLGSGRFVAESAGLEPRPIHPQVITVMKELGYDLSRNSSDSVFEFFRQGRLYDYVITVCEEAVEERCPVFPGIACRLRWPFPNPEELAGSEEEMAAALRKIRNDIRRKIIDFIQEVSSADSAVSHTCNRLSMTP
ncbi:arsenate reductase ArsC [Desulfoglaeba alkanexedens]|uniref:Arsenate reductase ArsC n=1 Tax=Desulfoglaeba alkanexedens ALDC TaxID=980445 RepID=A0A4P8L275_9BACT|nr:arsenate reductase ArsC [Desulfoglaeba alkanexedens]QCQ21743.1 arsenate reductase ArsC [Desulfoglaeba alkanexedens ALDC]